MKMKQSTGFFWLQNYLSWIVYGAGTLLIMMMQTAPRLFPVMGYARPAPLLLFAICVAMFEGPRIGAIIGVFAGLLWDLYAFRLFGLNALLLLAITVTVGLLVQLILRTNFLSGMLLCVSGVVIHTLLDWLICYALFMHEETWTVLYKVYLPNALYTVLLSPLIYWLVLLLARFIRHRKNG